MKCNSDLEKIKQNSIMLTVSKEKNINWNWMTEKVNVEAWKQNAVENVMEKHTIFFPDDIHRDNRSILITVFD